MSNRALCRARLVAASGLVLALGCGPRAPTVDHTPVRHEIAIRGMQFVPATIDAVVGDSVVFVNQDFFPHTATAVLGAWDSGDIAAYDSAVVVPRTAGDLEYRCGLHPTMRGTLRVRMPPST